MTNSLLTPSLSYETEYSSRFQRPMTTVINGRSPGSDIVSAPSNSSGFCSNGNFSPLELTKLRDDNYYVSSVHASHSKNSTINNGNRMVSMPHTTMEKSGFWSNSSTDGLAKSMSNAQQNNNKRDITSIISEQTLKKLAKKNPIEAENDGVGPVWGSTTNKANFQRNATNHERFRETNKSLIGKKEQNGFTRQHLTICHAPVVDTTSVYMLNYIPKNQVRNSENIPSKTVVEKSGFTCAQIPTINRKICLADHSPFDLHPTEINKLKHKNTPEYQNLFNPDPYLSTNKISYSFHKIQERGITSSIPRRGVTGYMRNGAMTFVIPGDPREAKTGHSETMKRFKDPSMGLKPRGFLMANTVDRSGFWGSC